MLTQDRYTGCAVQLACALYVYALAVQAPLASYWALLTHIIHLEAFEPVSGFYKMHGTGR